MRMIHVQLTKREANQLIRILGAYQELIESAIDASTVQDTGEATEPDEAQVARDRQDWKATEAWVKRLDEGN